MLPRMEYNQQHQTIIFVRQSLGVSRWDDRVDPLIMLAELAIPRPDGGHYHIVKARSVTLL